MPSISRDLPRVKLQVSAARSLRVTDSCLFTSLKPYHLPYHFCVHWSTLPFPVYLEETHYFTCIGEKMQRFPTVFSSVCRLYFYTTTTLTQNTSVTKWVGFCPHQAISCDTRWVSDNSTQYWHCLLKDSTQCHRNQFHKILPSWLAMPITSFRCQVSTCASDLILHKSEVQLIC